jgi:putative polyhydroxyalkanoate system protein
MTPPLTVEIPHQLGAAEARRRIDQGFANLAAQIASARTAEMTRTWEGDTLHFGVGALGQAITGQLHVMADRVRIEVVLPAVLGILAQAIRGRIQRQGQRLLEK